MNFRVALDGVVILTLIFYGGIGWQKISSLEASLRRFEVLDASRSGAAERLARIEEKTDRLQRDVDRILIRMEDEK